MRGWRVCTSCTPPTPLEAQNQHSQPRPHLETTEQSQCYGLSGPGQVWGRGAAPLQGWGRLGPAPGAANPPPALRLALTDQEHASDLPLMGLPYQTHDIGHTAALPPGAVHWRHLVAPMVSPRGLGSHGCSGRPPGSGGDACPVGPGGVGGSLKLQAWGTAPSDGQSSSPTLLQGTHVEEWTNTTPWGN